ncbi:dephospho-CoA kinase [Shewanella sp. JM162201]|uniref:Dephospho-CoA kinase n=1 Tax=Shewanella jiangmenensis TaxID=2837387 RepID=A0ABS5V4L7_9GAMM|nr:dephospho-CoA kinase [Shewanella jiangmenensis]MBT1443998.1 dephospho-CoA kinase [Shewanella jiangmenensis]
MSQFILGLTGGIGSGKTTVANLFAKKGITLVDADVIARDVVMPGTQGLAAIANHFGEGVLLPDGSLNRQALRERVFSAPGERLWLNGLLHPIIRSEMLDAAKKATSEYVILVVPLLFENGLDRLVDRTLVVDVEPSRQISRTARRDGVSEAQVANILASQISRDERLAKADDVINNNTDNKEDFAGLESQVTALHQRYLQLAASKKQHD